MSPTIHREGPYRFYFNSREEMRMHVHVEASKGRAKFWLEPFVVLADFHGLRKHELTDIQRIVEEKEDVFKYACANISRAEAAGQSQITSIEIDGFWLLTEDGEYFVSFEDYPEFREAPVKQIFHFDQAFDHFRWPDLDIDIELEALTHPDRFPLKFKR